MFPLSLHPGYISLTVNFKCNISFCSAETEGTAMEMESMTTPVIGLLVQGGPPDIDHIFWLLSKKIPVVVIQGSGLAADLVAFAYTEMEQK